MVPRLKSSLYKRVRGQSEPVKTTVTAYQNNRGHKKGGRLVNYTGPCAARVTGFGWHGSDESKVAKKSVDLLVRTPRQWVAAVMADFNAFLADHANCERKASALAMSMVVKYPDRQRIIPGLIDLAREELAHFAQVYALMQARGIPLVKDSQDPYVNELIALMRHGRDERFLDRLLISSLVESRGAERFRLVSAAMEEVELRHFYRDLWACEAKHGHVFVEMALAYFDAAVVYARLHELAGREADILSRLAIRAALH